MKKQINPTTKAHLIRGAFYLLLLLAVCAIPFALAQRNATKQRVARPAASSLVKSQLNPAAGQRQAAPPSTGAVSAQTQLSMPTGPRPQFPTTSSGATGANPVRTLRTPRYPQVILYDQYDNATLNAPVDITSQDFEPADDAFDAQAADDFVVPGGQTWNVSEVDIMGE